MTKPLSQPALASAALLAGFILAAPTRRGTAVKAFSSPRRV